jgi:hypothetical protein
MLGYVDMEQGGTLRLRSGHSFSYIVIVGISLEVQTLVCFSPRPGARHPLIRRHATVSPGLGDLHH